MLPRNWVLGILLWALQLQGSLAFTDYLLKKCSQSGFCHRNREYAKNIGDSKNSYYSIEPETIEYNDRKHTVRAVIQKRIPRPDTDEKIVELPFTLDLLDSGSVRFTIDEIRNATHLPKFLDSHRYNETPKWIFDKSTDLLPHPNVKITKPSWMNQKQVVITSEDKSLDIKLYLDPFKILIFYNKELRLSINDRMLLNIEHLRQPEEHFQHTVPEEISFNTFRDNFKDSKNDKLPFGPESVGLDFTFNGITDVYGIPEHADSLRLRDTTNGEPYRLFNVDVFEYNVDSTMPMYGAIPLMIGSKPESAVGVFWMNPADSWIDIDYDVHHTKTHWISESGIIDVIMMFGETPLEITTSYINLTGKPSLPPLSAIGYHQCRWNYNDETDVLTVDAEMDKAQIPYDFIWLDIEYTDEKKYFTWKRDSFPNPQTMLTKLAQLGRNLVTLIDPHIKVGYEVSETVEREDSAVRDHNGNVYHGHCWPGESIWIDTFSPIAQRVWKGFFQKFINGVENLHIWNDMNEPSIFSGPETTAPKDLIHYGGVEERSLHNLYGLTVHEATYDALKEHYADEDKRPFILTRSFFAGSQKTAATWTGDNVANWDYLRISIPMCLTNNIVGMPFIGADIAGFSGNPSDELLIRWYQAGLWYPFFRAHAHIDTERREPYLLSNPVKSIVRNAINLRYSLLPTFYTAFRDASVNGTPVMCPMFYVKPGLESIYSIEDQFYLGLHGLLIKPITQEGVKSTEVYFPPGMFYDYDSFEPITVTSSGYKTVDAPFNKIPIYLEGGHIITRKDRYRRSSKLMTYDPYTLVVAPGIEGQATGWLYVDDGETFAYENGAYLEVEFSLHNNILTSVVKHISTLDILNDVRVERILVGINDSIQLKDTVSVKQGENYRESKVSFSDNGNYAIINNPLVKISSDWEIIF